MVDTLNSKNLGRWNGRINTLNESLKTLSNRYPNANIKPMNNEKITRLAQIFENTRLAIDSYTNRSRMFEATNPQDVGPFKIHAYDMIAGLYPTMIADELVSVQAMSQRIGQIYFLNYVYGTDRGGVLKGDSMLSALTGAADYNNYAGERIEDEIVDENHVSGDLSAHLSNFPVRPGTVVFTTDSGNITDNGEGKLINASGAVVGSIDYRNGKVEITALANSALVQASYFQDLGNAPTFAGEVNVRVDCATINATPHKLRALYSMDAGYDLQMAYGLDIDQELLKTCTAEIRHERDGNIISTLYRQAGAASTWDRKIPVGVSQLEHYNSFIAHLFEDCTTIFQATKRKMGNWVVCGKDAIDILNAVGAPRFVGNGLASQSGPHFAGMLDNRLKVFFDPFLPNDTYLVGYKGDGLIDSGFILADYLPIFSTSMVMLDDFVGRRGFASIYGTKMINNRMYVAGKVVNM
jgi:hypothetical protein